MPVYESDPNMLPDSAFEPGELHHLVPGNEGRMLDTRRTPVRVVELRPATGMFVVRIEAFEDKGALWEVPFEEVPCYQFAKGGRRAESTEEIREAIERFNRPLQIPRNVEAHPATTARIRELAAVILSRPSSLSLLRTGSDGEGPPADGAVLAHRDDIGAFLGDLAPMETAFARQFVSNPYSGEMVKGHRIVLAELGLVAYDGTIVRDPTLFAGEWSRARRAEHIVRRLAFVQALYRRLGYDHVCLFRGMSLRGAPQPPRNHGFISATFDFDVAKSHLEAGATGVLYRQLVPIERLFMTYRETPQMNEHFKEAEAVLLYDECSPMF